MKMILNIGNELWLADNAATPAKVADLLGTMTPIEEYYPPDSKGGAVLSTYQSRSWRHETSMKEYDGRKILSKAEYLKWHAEHDKPEETAVEPTKPGLPA